MKQDTASQYFEGKKCGECLITMGTHEEGMISVLAITVDGKIVVPEKYYHSYHNPETLQQRQAARLCNLSHPARPQIRV